MQSLYTITTRHCRILDRSPAALNELLLYSWESTVWTDVHAGYVGAMHDSGLASGVLLQVGEELRSKLPRVMRGHKLGLAWAFKYNSSRDGIGTHADQAAINVNCWITPDSANLDRSAACCCSLPVVLTIVLREHMPERYI